MVQVVPDGDLSVTGRAKGHLQTLPAAMLRPAQAGAVRRVAYDVIPPTGCLWALEQEQTRTYLHAQTRTHSHRRSHPRSDKQRAINLLARRLVPGERQAKSTGEAGGQLHLLRPASGR